MNPEMGQFAHDQTIVHHLAEKTRIRVGKIGRRETNVAQSVGIEELRQLVQRQDVLRRVSRLDALRNRVVRLIVRTNQSELQMPIGLRINYKRSDRLGPFSFEPWRQHRSSHPISSR